MKNHFKEFDSLETDDKKGKNIIFVSGDQKKDWWEEWHGKKIRPRVELITEFREKTGHEIIFYTQLGFMKYAKENLGLEAKNETITEVETVDTADAEESIGLLPKHRSLIKTWLMPLVK